MSIGFRRVLPAAGLLALLASPALAQWTGDPAINTAITREYGFEQFPEVASDGAGGVIVAWQIQRGGTLGYDLRLARLDALGFWKWAMDLVVAAGDQRDHHVISDGAGGVIVTWTDNRDAPLDYDIYAQRVDALGNAQWAAHGVAVCDEPSIQAYARAAPDGAGGAVIAWRDSRHYGSLGVNVYAQRVNASGAALWTADGVPVCQAFGNQLDPGIAATSTGEFVIAWADGRAGSTNEDIAAQKLNGAGVPQWTTDGVVLALGASQRWFNDVNPVLGDGEGGAFVVFEDDTYGAADVDLHVTRFAADGSFAWSPATRVVCTAVGIQRLAQPIAASGGVVVPWVDQRYGVADPDVYAQRVDAAGAALWGADGRSIAGTVAAEADPVVVRERGGSLFFAWTENRGGDPDVWARRHAADGTPLC